MLAFGSPAINSSPSELKSRRNCRKPSYAPNPPIASTSSIQIADQHALTAASTAVAKQQAARARRALHNLKSANAIILVFGASWIGTAVLGYFGAAVGIFGMNVKATVFAGGHLTFKIIIGIMFVTSAGAILFSRIKKWI